MTLPEPSNYLAIFFTWFIPFGAYFLGVYIRKRAFVNEDSPPLKQQMLMAIPVCLVVVAPIIATLDINNALSGNLSNYIFTIGVIMENGMIMQKTLTEHLSSLGSKKLP